MTQRALQYIEQNKAKPFFMYVAFNIPHYPEQSDAKFDKRYEKLPMPRRSYAKMISTVDDRMGRVLTKLEELKLRDNTIVIFMSDNGSSAEQNHIRVDNHKSGLAKGTKYGANGGGGNTGKWTGHKGTFFEGGIRVPAIISYPAALPKGQVRDQAITAMDWMPTVLDLAKVPLPKVELDGKSLLPIIKDNAPTHYKVMHWQWNTHWAVREGDWKLIGRGRSLFLGNLAEENPERTNHVKQKPDLVKRLQNLHEDWVKQVMPKS